MNLPCLLYEFKDGVNKYLSTANSKMKTLADVIEFNKKNEAKAMPYFKQETLELADKKGDLEHQRISRCGKKYNRDHPQRYRQNTKG